MKIPSSLEEEIAKLAAERYGEDSREDVVRLLHLGMEGRLSFTNASEGLDVIEESARILLRLLLGGSFDLPEINLSDPPAALQALERIEKLSSEAWIAAQAVKDTDRIMTNELELALIVDQARYAIRARILMELGEAELAVFNALQAAIRSNEHATTMFDFHELKADSIRQAEHGAAGGRKRSQNASVPADEIYGDWILRRAQHPREAKAASYRALAKKHSCKEERIRSIVRKRQAEDRHAR